MPSRRFIDLRLDARGDCGRGAAGFTNITTRSGSSGFHGSVFEFLRNSALDASNYFDHSSIAPNPAESRRFGGNEFGFTNGGPVILLISTTEAERPFLTSGNIKASTGSLERRAGPPVPTASQRLWLDTTAFQAIRWSLRPLLRSRRFSPLSVAENPTGSYGAQTYAVSSKVVYER